MCEYEKFVFTCGHTPVRRSVYCHAARCNERHNCYSVKVLKRVWQQRGICPDCVTAHANAQVGEGSESWPQGQGVGVGGRG